MSKLVSKTSPLSLIITSDHIDAKSERADRVLALFPELPSRSQLKVWFEEGRIRRGLELLSASSKVYVGDQLSILLREEKQIDLEPRRVDFKIYFEDEYLIVLFKPRGLSMHPGASRRNETTLVHALLAHSKTLSSVGGDFRPGIVHRLDKETEGIVVVAKDNVTHEGLSQQFSHREIQRRYWALCCGRPPNEMKIDAPIARHPIHRKKMWIHTSGRESQTQVKRLQVFKEGYSWVECKLLSGRTHQIRVHLSSKGYPILNDPVYGRPRKMSLSEEKSRVLENLKGQALIAFELGFIHPRTKEKISFQEEPPLWLSTLTQVE